ncbi:hypothetical protein CMO88_00810 [Candidatus Woesearchaeota archaeon]|nr:hypothetical protein [Candidatus Woesearchaeota archaeon]
MLEWLTGSKKTEFLAWLDVLKSYTEDEIKRASQLDDADGHHEQLQRVLGEENVERNVEHHLVAEFIRKKPELMKKSPALTMRLEALITGIREKVEHVFYDLTELQEALKDSDQREIISAKRTLSARLTGLEKDIKDAVQVSTGLQELEPIPNVYCTSEFRKHLKRKEFSSKLKKIESWLSRIGRDPDWFMGNSEKLHRFDFFAFPQGRERIRIIYRETKGGYLIYDIFTHDDYIRAFKQGKKLPDYHGKIRVIKPLKQFAFAA